jgi:predicted phage terminase large subunit-like protein
MTAVLNAQVDTTKPLSQGEKDKILEGVSSMTEQQRIKLLKMLQPRLIEKYMVHIPHPKQQVYLSLKVREAMYGGAAGGGKSDSLLMAALQYVDVPGYSALLLRRTWPDLSSPGAILDRARSWLMNTDAQIREGGRVWIFPSGARLTFGTILRENDKFKYQSAEYQFIGFDELTQFDESQYTYMFSRIRRPELACMNCNKPVRRQRTGWKHSDPNAAKSCPHLFPDPKVLDQYPASDDGISVFDVPLRMRSATNPGGRGHEWVFNRFINPKTKTKTAVFVPAFLADNPSLDQASYLENLSELTDVEKERLLNGDWNITESGDMFERHYFKMLKEAPKGIKTVRAWDNAATGNGGDWTVGAKVSLIGGRWVVEDIIRGQWTSAQKEVVIAQTAALDGPSVPIVMEQEPGSSGVDVIDHYRRDVLVGFSFYSQRPTGDKATRAMPLAASAEAGNVYLVEGRWNSKFIDEIVQFPKGNHDDQVDAVTLGQSWLANTSGRGTRLLV